MNEETMDYYLKKIDESFLPEEEFKILYPYITKEQFNRQLKLLLQDELNKMKNEQKPQEK